MPDDVVHVVEDAFHRLQHPQQDHATDEDLANAALLTIHNCAPDLHGRIRASATDGHLTLTGTVENALQRRAIEVAVSKCGAKSVTNAIEIVGAAAVGEVPHPTADHQVAGEPMLYVTRHCGLEPYSLTAALHDAIGVLDRRFAELNLPVPEEVVVVYRNRLPESVVLDIGYALSPSAQVVGSDDLRLGRTPEGAMFAAPAQFGARELFEVHDQLLRRTHLAELSPAAFSWQRLSLQNARLPTEHPASLLFVPAD